MTLNFYIPRGRDKSTIQPIKNLISFRINDTYFHHDVLGHEAGVALPRNICADLCVFSAIFLQIFPLFSLFLFSFILRIYLIFFFVLALHVYLDKQGF